MNFLNCNVTNCANNSENICSLKKINIEGPGACVASQTCCSSFALNGSTQNNIQINYAPETNITCKAGNCKYNKRGKCSAENVNVTNMSASPTVMGETECLTFSAR